MSDISKNRVAAVLLVPWLAGTEFLLFQSLFILMGVILFLISLVRVKIQKILFKEDEHPLTATVFFIFIFSALALFFGSATESLKVFVGCSVALFAVHLTIRLWQTDTYKNRST